MRERKIDRYMQGEEGSSFLAGKNLSIPSSPEGFGIQKKKVKVFVNFEKNQITIIRINKRQIFNTANRFFIEGDSQGFSYLEKRQDGIYFVNVLKGRFENEILEERKISIEEAKKIIRDVILET
jgi:hypothetical protein